MARSTEVAAAVTLENLRTVRQIAESSPVFSEASLRWLIFNAKQNGLEPALIRVNRRVLIDLECFNEWLEERRGGGAR